MLSGYDIAYYALAGLTAPLWATRRRARDKVRDALATRDGRATPRVGREPAVLVHAVSVGELNAARGLIERLQAERPGLHVIVTTTTTTGHELNRKLFGDRPDTTVLRFPIDLSANVSRLLDALRPTLVVLMELEVWPNFLKQCAARQIPVAIANGRITEPSYKKYRLLGPLGRSTFRRLAWCVAQDEVYAARFAKLGVPPERLAVAGTMKFDTASVGDRVPGDAELARDVGLPLPSALPPSPGTPVEGGGEGETRARRPPVVVAGSTGPGEEAILLDVYAHLLRTHDKLRLAIVPRRPERFDEVAKLIEARGFACVRRSRSIDPGGRSSLPLAALEVPAEASRSDALQLPVVLGDTMGELRKFYALAEVVFVGRTLVDLGRKQHGSDMIEPCALARPTIVGPFTGNFEEPMRAFRSAGAIVEVADAAGLVETLDAWLSATEPPREIGRRAQQVVVAGKGSVTRHVELLLPLLS